MRRLPTQEQLAAFLEKDFQSLLKAGYSYEQAISRVLEEYDYIANVSNEFKFAVYQHVNELALEKGLHYPNLQSDINDLRPKMLTRA